MVATVRITVGVQCGGWEAMHAAGKDAKEAQMGVSLILHPTEVVVEILLHAEIGAGDKTQVHQKVVAEFELLSRRLRADGENNYQ